MMLSFIERFVHTLFASLFLCRNRNRNIDVLLLFALNFGPRYECARYLWYLSSSSPALMQQTVPIETKSAIF